MPIDNLILPIVSIVIVIIFAAWLIGKRNTEGLQGMGLHSFLKPFEIYINLNTLTVGRLSGSEAIKPMDREYSLIRYQKGFWNFPSPDRVPNYAIRRFHPPLSGMLEGVCIILPYKAESPLAENYEVLGVMVEQKREINRLKTLAATLKRIINAGNDTQAALQLLEKLNDVSKKLSAGVEKVDEKATIIETAGLKEQKKPKAM